MLEKGERGNFFLYCCCVALYSHSHSLHFASSFRGVRSESEVRKPHAILIRGPYHFICGHLRYREISSPIIWGGKGWGGAQTQEPNERFPAGAVVAPASAPIPQFSFCSLTVVGWSGMDVRKSPADFDCYKGANSILPRNGTVQGEGRAEEKKGTHTPRQAR